VRVDDGEPTPLAASLDNKWSPTVAVVEGRIHAAWTDFREYNWDIFATRSLDGGRRFEPSVKVNDFDDLERLCDRPRFVAEPGGSLRLVWTDLRAREPDTNLFFAVSLDQGQSFSANHQLDGSRRGFVADRDLPSNQDAVALAATGQAAYAAWQDDRYGNNDILFARLSSGPEGGAVEREDRVDDTGRGPSNQYRPELAIAGAGTAARCLVVWEDDREGELRVYGASRSCAPAPRVRLPRRQKAGQRPF